MDFPTYNFAVPTFLYRCVNNNKKDFQKGDMFAEFLQWIDQGHCCNYNPGVYSNSGSITSWVKDGSSWPKYGPYMSTAISDEYLKEHNLCDGEPNKLLIKINTSELNIIKPSIKDETNVKFSVRDFRETSSVNLQLKSPIQSGEDRKTYMFDISDQGLNEQFKNFYLHNRGISGRYGLDEFPALQAAKKVGEIVIVSNELTLDKVSVEDDRFPEWYGKSIQEISDDYNNDWRQVRDFMISRINTPLQDVDTTDYYDRNFQPNQRKITMRIHRDQWESVPGRPRFILSRPQSQQSTKRGMDENGEDNPRSKKQNAGKRKKKKTKRRKHSKPFKKKETKRRKHSKPLKKKFTKKKRGGTKRKRDDNPCQNVDKQNEGEEGIVTAACNGSNDPVSLDEIEDNKGICFQKQCYDYDSLIKWLKYDYIDNNLDTILNARNPYNRQPIGITLDRIARPSGATADITLPERLIESESSSDDELPEFTDDEDNPFYPYTNAADHFTFHPDNWE